jgi:hypothetical protein
MDNDLDLELLRDQYQKKFLANQLKESQNPMADLGLKLAGGGIDLLSRHAQSGADVSSILTGIQQPTRFSSNVGDQVTQALAARDTRARQAALDDLGSITAIQKLIDSKKEQALKEDEAAYKKELRPLEKRKVEAEIQKLQAEARKKSEEKKEFKKDQYDAGTFAKRIEQTEGVFDALDKSGYNRASLGQEAQSMLPRFMQGENLRKQDQAERNFINAVLRRESGAAISDSEFKNAEIQYLPRPGDTPEVKAQKKANRMQVLAGLKTAAGRAYDQIPLVQTESPEQTKEIGGVKYKKVDGGWQRI